MLQYLERMGGGIRKESPTPKRMVLKFIKLANLATEIYCKFPVLLRLFYWSKKTFLNA
jgi:hypothetical protein